MRRFTIGCILLLVFISNSFSQNVKYGVGGGLTFILGSDAYSGEIDTLGSQYGFKSNYHIGLKVKALLPASPVRFSGMITYTSLSGSKDNVIIYNPAIPGPSAVDLETSVSIFTLAAGVEYLLAPEPVSPYLLLNIQLNSFGDFSFKRISTTGNIETNYDGGTRFGLGVGAGLDFGILPQFDIDATAALNFYNLLGKERNEDGLTGLNLTLNILYHLR